MDSFAHLFALSGLVLGFSSLVEALRGVVLCCARIQTWPGQHIHGMEVSVATFPGRLIGAALTPVDLVV